MGSTVLSEHSVHEAEFNVKEKEKREFVVLLSAAALIFVPYFFLLPVLVYSMRRKRWSTIPVSEYWDKARVWNLVFLSTSFSLFYFIVFPVMQLCACHFPLWSFYPYSPYSSMSYNVFMFTLYGLAMPVATGIFLRGILQRTQSTDIDKNALIVPTRQGNIVIEKYNTGLMVLGAPGSGKTELIKQLIYQFPGSRDSVWIVFDPKDDYYSEFGTEDDIVLSVNDSTHGWNIFMELDPDSHTTDAIEMAKEIFPMGKEEDKFWVVTSQQLFSAFVRILYRKSRDDSQKEKIPTNESFMDFINSLTIEKAYNLLMQYEDLKSVAEYINPRAMKQASGVWSNFYSRLNEIFIGDFYRTASKPQMSIREYVRNPQGRKLFIEYNVETGEAVTPIFRLLIDRAIKYSFSRSNQYTGKEPKNKYFVIDEFQLIPKLKRYQELVNFGRSYFITSVIGIQSIAQVIEKYGKDSANAIVAGHGYLFALRSYDRESTELIRDRIGRKAAWQREPVSSNFRGKVLYLGDRYSLLEYSPFSEEHIRTMKTGECIIVTPDGYREVALYPYKTGREIIDKIRKQS